MRLVISVFATMVLGLLVTGCNQPAAEAEPATAPDVVESPAGAPNTTTPENTGAREAGGKGEGKGEPQGRAGSY